jgi:hypothetical protein
MCIITHPFFKILFLQELGLEPVAGDLVFDKTKCTSALGKTYRVCEEFFKELGYCIY